jgi:tetratricopeptide (TPR) repeat protein
MIHRDIKPGNVLLTRSAASGREADELAKVLDFGIAKIREAQVAAGGATLTRTGTSIGTPAYMSPEQAMGKTGEGLDGRADLYSLGVVMYEMLTGELPIQAETEVQMLIGQISTAPQPIRSRRPELPEGIGAVVMRCLEKDPARRPASAAALIALIEASESGVPAGPAPDEMPTVATRRPVPVETPGEVPARRPARWVWVALLVALVVSARGVWHLGSRRKSVANSPSVGGPSTTNSRPLPEAAPRMPPPPQMPAQQNVPSKAPETNTPPVPQSGAEQGSNPADDIQGALNAIPVDAATKKQVKDILRQSSELMKKGDFDGATAQYRRLAQLRPGWGPTVAALTALAAQRASPGVPAQNRARAGELAGTVAHYSMEAGLHPNVASYHYKLGAALGKISDLDGDIREQQQALRLEPSMAAAHAELGGALALKESWDDAAQEYREAIRLKPHLAEAHSGLGDALGHTGDWQGEIAEERMAIQQAPSLAMAHFRLATALEHEGDSSTALKEYQRAAELDPLEANFQANYKRLARQINAR